MVEQRWVLIVKSLNRPGVLAAAASVFSNRGVSLETVLGSGIASTRTEDARFILGFRATERKQKMLLRALERLSTVLEINAYSYNDPNLRTIAVAKVSQLDGIDLSTVATETISQTDQERMLLLTGSVTAVEQLIEQLRQQNLLLDVVITTITV
jgi:acetolactate synthase small subunit